MNDDDVAAVTLPKKLKGLRAAKNSALATNALIDPAQIKDPRIKAYLAKSVKDLVRMIGSEDFDRRLLPPTEQE